MTISTKTVIPIPTCQKNCNTGLFAYQSALVRMCIRISEHLLR